MSSDRWVRAEQIYRSALAQDPASRDTYVADACHGDEDLRSEVRFRLESTDGDVRHVAHYQILERVGAGGMGQVFKARDRKLDRLVAIKFLAPHLLVSPDARQRFLREAHALSALSHPHIATIFDADEVDGEPYLVLEYLSGGTLHRKLRHLTKEGNSLGPGAILKYAIQITDGLAHAHRRDIVHRDIKTGNILLNAEGTLKITDFGLAKFRNAGAITHTGMPMGTVAYMAPEQIRGENTDYRSDLFSLGVVLYELAAGFLPFQGEHDQAVLYQILHHAPPRLGEVRRDLPPAFSAVVQKALEKDPEHRFQRAEPMLEEFHRLQRELESSSDSPTIVPTITIAVGPKKLARFRRWPVAAALLLIALAATAMVVPGIRRAIPGLRPSASLPAGRHLAILPFVNVGNLPAHQAFCDGVAETLTSSLTQLEQFQGSLFVVPASEMRRPSIANVRDAQRTFGINLAVTGSVQRTDDGVRLTVNLIDAKSLVQLGARTVDFKQADLGGMEDKLLDLVTGLLEIQLRPEARKVVSIGGTAVPQAYDAYLQGRGYLRRMDLPGNLERAVSSFQQAIEKDDRYALAYTGLSEGYLRLFGRDKSPDWLPQAQSAGSKAVSLSPSLAPAHVSLGMVYATRGAYDEAVAEFQRALKLDSTSADAYRELAGAYEKTNRIQDAEDTYRKALDLRPGDWQTCVLAGAFYYTHGQLEKAEPLFRKVIDLTPDNFNGYLNLGGLYIAMGRYDDAEARLRQSINIRPTSRAYSNLGTLSYQRGQFGEAVNMFEKAVAIGDAPSYLLVANLADSYRWAPGMQDRAASTYRRAIHLAEQQLAVNPNNASALSSIATYHAKAGEKKQAQTAIRRARQLAPADQTVGFKAVVVFELTGKRSDALKTLEEILKGGYKIQQVETEPELSKLRQDSHYSALKSRYGSSSNDSRSK